MTEYLDYFDADYNYLGIIQRSEIYTKGVWYHTFNCWIVNENNNLVIQLRSKNKLRGPNLLDMSAGGHLQAGEKLEDGVREIKEEIGLDVNMSQLKYLGYYKGASDEDGKISRQFSNTYFLKNNTPIKDYKLQKEEVDGIFELDINQGRKLFLNQVEKIEIKGYLANQDGILIPETRMVTKTNFKQRSNKFFWLKIFNCAEDFINGRKEIYI